MIRAVIGAVVAALLAVAPLLTAGEAAASPTPSECEGVWVIVDRDGDSPDLRCATRFSTGSEALASAGFKVERRDTMICRIDAHPRSCTLTMTEYWSYWQAHRQPDGSFGPWTYATLGPDSYQPRRGDLEGWSYGRGGKVPPALVPPAGSTRADATGPPTPDPPPRTPSAPPDTQTHGSPTGTIATLVLLALAGLALGLARWRRRRGR